MERETGLEPATSSLGIQTYIGSKSLARFCCEFLNLQRLAESAFSRIDRLNEAQTRHVPSNKEPTATVGRVWNRWRRPFTRSMFPRTHRTPLGSNSKSFRPPRDRDGGGSPTARLECRCRTFSVGQDSHQSVVDH